MTRQERKKTAQQYLAEDRRRQVAILLTQSYSEMEIAEKLGVDNSTISKDIKVLKLISQQFIYDITKSDFTFYYRQCLETVKLILRKQWEIAEKEQITTHDMNRAKILSDILSTVATINGYYSVAPKLHKSPMQQALDVDTFGIRTGTPIHKMTVKEEAEQLKLLEEEMHREYDITSPAIFSARD